MIGAETFRFDLGTLLDLDILSFDRLLQQSRDARNHRLMEEASINRIVVGSGFSGEEKPFQKLLDAYTPEHLKEADDQKRIERDIRRLGKLFGG